MKVSNAEFTIAEYVSQMKKGDIVINRDYQRTKAVWPPAARSYLIDTIIQGYPIPKLSLYQKTNLRTRTTTKEIVDGQQRSHAIRDFFENSLRLSGHSSLRGKTYDDLESNEKQSFLSYTLSADVIAAASDEDIREVFRRINSYNVPLNHAEKRHATYQGEFKWFIVSLCEEYAQTLKELGIYTEQQLGRMNDAALFTEVCYSLSHGIDHASEKKLDSLYKDYDLQIPWERDLLAAIKNAMKFVVGIQDFRDTSLFAPYNIYSLMTAVGHVTRRAKELQKTFRIYKSRKLRAADCMPALAILANALERDLSRGPLRSFVESCAQKTNRRDTRETRFIWFCRALTGRIPT